MILSFPRTNINVSRHIDIGHSPLTLMQSLLSMNGIGEFLSKSPDTISVRYSPSFSFHPEPEPQNYCRPPLWEHAD